MIFRFGSSSVLPLLDRYHAERSGTIQLFRQSLSHKSVKACATMPIGVMGRKSLALID